jgi:hypothetical protein
MVFGFLPLAVKALGDFPFCLISQPIFKEVLRRENQGLKVYTVERSSVFSMTGTYFWFVLSILCRWFRFAQLAKGKKFRP